MIIFSDGFSEQLGMGAFTFISIRAVSLINLDVGGTIWREWNQCSWNTTTFPAR